MKTAALARSAVPPDAQSDRRARFIEWFAAMAERADHCGIYLERPSVQELQKVDTPELAAMRQ